jgi:hypothetical protein
MEFSWTDEESTYRRGAALVDEWVPDWREHRSIGTSTEERGKVTAFTHELRDRDPDRPLAEGIRGADQRPGCTSSSVRRCGPSASRRTGHERELDRSGDRQMGPRRRSRSTCSASRREAFWCQGSRSPTPVRTSCRCRRAARRRGVVNGQKIWTSHTQLASGASCWCDRPEPKRTRGSRSSWFRWPRRGSRCATSRTSPGSRRSPRCSSPASVSGGEQARTREQRVGHRARLSRTSVGAPRWERATAVLGASSWAGAQPLRRPAGPGSTGRGQGSREAARLLAYAVVDERAKQLPPSPAT